MAPARQLFELQRLEVDNDDSRNTILVLESELANTQLIDQASHSLENAKKLLSDIHLRQKRTELEIGECEERLRITEDRLYAGQTTNPRELLGLENEIQSLRAKKQQAEDHFLDLMVQAEQTETDIAGAKTNLEGVERQQVEKHDELSAKREQLTKQLVSQEHQQQTIRSTIPPTELAIYEALKKSKGNPIAQVEHGICRGCGLMLSSHELQRARTATDIVRCGSCSRILYIV